MTIKQFVVIPLSILMILGCEDPKACSSDEDCREGYRCDLEVYVGEFMHGESRRIAGSCTPKRKMKQKPNAPCACGSGRKYKKCCGGS